MMVIICCTILVVLIVIFLTSINVHSISQDKKIEETILQIESKEIEKQEADIPLGELPSKKQEQENTGSKQVIDDEAFRQALQSFQEKKDNQHKKMNDSEYRQFLREMAQRRQ